MWFHLVSRTVYTDTASAIDDGRVANMAGDMSIVVLAVTCAFWSLAVVVVATRMLSRTLLTRFRGWDDWIMLAALLFSTVDQSLKIAWYYHGLGQHVADVSLPDLQTFAKIAYAIAVNYPISLGLVKISILTFYLRLFPYDRFRIACYVMIAIVMCVNVAFPFAFAFACAPISNAWALVITQGSCVNKEALQYTASGINLITDLAVLLMPMRYFLAMTLKSNTRYGVVALFSLGTVSCVASAVRISTIYSFYNGDDPTFDAYPIAIWSAIEINLTIITASIPSLKPLFFRYVLGRRPDSSRRRSDDKSWSMSTKATRSKSETITEKDNTVEPPSLYPDLEDSDDEGKEVSTDPADVEAAAPLKRPAPVRRRTTPEMDFWTALQSDRRPEDEIGPLRRESETPDFLTVAEGSGKLRKASAARSARKFSNNNSFRKLSMNLSLRKPSAAETS